MWKLSKQGDQREYTNAETSGRCTTTKVYTDKDGNDWYCFDDLMNLPYTRSFAANRINALYQLGLTKTDADQFFAKHKATLKAKDNGDKYEMAYAETLDFESKFKAAMDPIRHQSSLTCVYFLLADEVIDSFHGDTQMRKMSLIEADPDMHAFFFKRQMDITESYINRLGIISQIASPILTEQLVPTD